MARLGEALEEETSTKKTEVCFCSSLTGYKTKLDMNQSEISLNKKLKLQVVNYALETNISDGVHKIII